MMSILRVPQAYMFVQNVIGARKARYRMLADYACIDSSHRVLDIGCGPGFIVEGLNGADYVGFDVEPAYIRYARRRYGDKGRFYCRLFDEEVFSEIGTFDFVLMNGLLHHLSDGEVRILLSNIKRVLRESGQVLTLDGCYTENQGAIETMLLKGDRGKYVRIQNAYLDLMQSEFNRVEAFVRKDYMYIPYSLLIMRAWKN